MVDEAIDVVQLLCDISEASDEAFHAHRLGCNRESGARILAGLGAVTPGARLETVVCRACDEDHPATIEFDAAKGRYVHFCPVAGFVAADDDDLCTSRLEPNWILDWLTTELSVESPMRRRVLLSGRVWYLGDATCADALLTVIFARRVSSQTALDLLASVLRSVHPADKGLVITTSPHVARQVQLPNGFEFLDLRDIARSGGDRLFVIGANLASWVQGLLGRSLPAKRLVRGVQKNPREPSRVDWRDADKPLIAEMHAMILDGKASNATDAARAIARQAPGNGKEASKVTRLATAYLKLYPRV